MNPIHFYSSLILRTPNLPEIHELAEEDVLKKLKDAEFLEAIYIASPSLYFSILNLNELSPKDYQSTLFAVAKYLLRASGRCTPFGLFSGVGLCEWGEKTNLKVKPKAKRVTRFDMSFLCSVQKSLESDFSVKENLKYFPNSSIYKLGGQLRYVEYLQSSGKRSYQVSAIEENELIDEVFNQVGDGLTFSQCAEVVRNCGFEKKESEDFIQLLIENQILVSELEPSASGSGYLEKILKSVSGTRNAGPLQKLQSLLVKLDQRKVNTEEHFREIYDQLESLGIPFSKKALFQVTTFQEVEGTVNADHKKELLEVVNQLGKCSFLKTSNSIEEFVQRFYKRYEEQEVPLLEALDDEIGIGFGNNSEFISPLLEDINWDSDSAGPDLRVNSSEYRMFHRLLRNEEYEVPLCEFTESAESIVSLAPTYSLIFRLLSGGKLLFEMAGGSSALNLSARFADGNEDLKKKLIEIAEDEQNNSKAILAEIVHFPQEKVGNIIYRPSFRKYEIPYLAHSEVVKNHQIPARNLMVSVKKGKVFIRDSVSGNVIIPRLSNAHNYTFESLPLYQFLGELQTQGFQSGLQFNWPSWAVEFPFLPRVTHKNVIVKRAEWNLSESDILAVRKIDSFGKFKVWRSKWSIPDKVILAEGDNELVISFNSGFGLDLFRNEIRNKKKIKLLEFLDQTGQCTSSNSKETFANQLVAWVNSGKSTGKQVLFENTFSQSYQRTFNPGSEWLYIKVYCSQKTGDKTLTSVLYPLVQKLKSEGLVTIWHFVRFTDPDFHLRIRFLLKSKEDFPRVLDLIQEHLNPFINSRAILKIQLESYNRELERYGEGNIEIAEKIHDLDSSFVTYLLCQTEGDEREEFRWKMGMKSVDMYLSTFGYTLDQKHDLAEKNRKALMEEFKVSKSEKKQLDQKYRSTKLALEDLLSNNEEDLFKDFEYRLSTLLHQTEASNSVSRNSLVSTFIHMSINRIILMDPRRHEMLIYDMMSRYYRSALAKKK